MTNRQHQQHSDHREGGAAWDVQFAKAVFPFRLCDREFLFLTTTAGGDLGGLFMGAE